MSNNLKNLRKKFRVSAQQLADSIKISRAYLYDLEKLDKIPESYEETFMKIFSCEKKDLYTSENQNETGFSKSIRVKFFPDIELLQGDDTKIEGEVDPSYYKIIDTDMLELFKSSKEVQNQTNLSLIRINGNSMNPILKNGNWVTVDHSQKIPSESSQIFIVRNKNHGGIFVKYIRRKITGIYEIFSANKDYEQDNILIKDLENSDFEIVGRVISCFIGI